MKCLFAGLLILLLFLPSISFAGWQVAKPACAVPKEAFFQAGGSREHPSIVPAYSGNVMPNQYSHLGGPVSLYAISVSGSLKENIERIMDRYHWRVIWKAPFDYNFDGRISGASLPNVIEKLLSPFPLQATLYMSNHTMTVTQRKV